MKRNHYGRLSATAKIFRNLSPLVSKHDASTLDLSVLYLSDAISLSEKNHGIRYTSRATNGFWLYYNLDLDHFTLFNKRHLTVHAVEGSKLYSSGKKLFGVPGDQGKDYRFWRLDGLELIQKLLGYLHALPVIGSGEEDSRSRNIEAWVKEAVWERDGGKCRVCGTTRNLHFDHDVPFAKGGGNHIKNVKLLCAEHNLSKSDTFKH